MDENGPKGIQFYALPGNPEEILQAEKFRKAFFEGGMKEQMEVMLDKNLMKETFKVSAEVYDKCKPDILLCGIANIQGYSSPKLLVNSNFISAIF